MVCPACGFNASPWSSAEEFHAFADATSEGGAAAQAVFLTFIQALNAVDARAKEHRLRHLRPSPLTEGDGVDHVRRWRHEAVELAVRALRPVAGAYDLPGLGESGVRADYGEAIIGLAERLGAYIQNGT